MATRNGRYSLAQWMLLTGVVVLGSNRADAVHPPEFWFQEGPAYNGYGGGAVSGIAVDPVNIGRVYAAAVNGGIWATQDITANPPTWAPLTDQAPGSPSMSAVAISALDSNTLFAGTGCISSTHSCGVPQGEFFSAQTRASRGPSSRLRAAIGSCESCRPGSARTSRWRPCSWPAAGAASSSISKGGTARGHRSQTCL